MARRLLIRCGWLVSVDREIGDLRDGEIVIEGDEIVAVGTGLNAQADEVIDASRMIVMPGLVNAHIHTWQAALRGVGSEWLSPDYHRNMHSNMATRYTARDTYLANLFGALNQIDKGATTVLDWCHNLRDLEMAEAALDGLEQSGIRAVFAHGTAKPPQKEGEPPFARIPHPRDRVEALRRNRLSGDDRLVTLAMAILGPEFGTFDVAVEDLKLARELDLLSTAHVWWGYNRNDPENGPKDGYLRLAAMGLLGPKHNVVHGNYLDDPTVKAIIDTGASITSTVLVETHGHPGEPLHGRVRDLGAMPSIGNDVVTLVSDDMYQEMRAALLVLRYREHRKNRAAGNPPLGKIPVASREALEWATIGGARALCLDHRIGSLTPGKKADLIMLDAEDPGLFPVHDPIFAVVDEGTSASVRDVMIGGEFRKRDGRLLVADDRIRRLRDELRASGERIMEESGYRPKAA